MDEPRRFVQVVSGPRQVGKTTVVAQVMPATNRSVVFASADEPTLAIEVKSGRPRHTRSGLEAFRATFGAVPILVVGSGGMPLAEFLDTPLDVLVG